MYALIKSQCIGTHFLNHIQEIFPVGAQAPGFYLSSFINLMSRNLYPLSPSFVFPSSYNCNRLRVLSRLHRWYSRCILRIYFTFFVNNKQSSIDSQSSIVSSKPLASHLPADALYYHSLRQHSCAFRRSLLCDVSEDLHLNSFCTPAASFSRDSATTYE
jgi:hypothetical protein